MREWILAVLTLMVAGALFLLSCDSGGDGGDDDDDDCDAENVGGSYAVTQTWEEESCNEDRVGESENGTMTIEQDDTKAKVYFQKFGPGSELEKVFEGTVCGYNITGSDEKDVALNEGVDCTAHRQSNYSLQLNPDTNQLSGEFTGTYIWTGSDCQDYGITPNKQCTWRKSIGPYTP